ncbi:hypothetical protein [Rarobacter incanus]|uniref:Uncharacterized protein n=1 Tax=Rarobacter incanus TaxID=153494 RepID=A0A542SNQ2_9MICO|nr:hypothetical protein [Rarobacter incanus]TQK75887.1 hypothetical protein FB389_0529 [Rarobacter incanus]
MNAGWAEITLAVLIVLLILGLSASRYARRLDRLHRKVLASRMALDAQLVRRALSAARMAHAGYFDPVTAVLVLECTDEVISSSGTIDPDQLGPDIPQRLAHPGDGPSREAVATGLEETGFTQRRIEAESDLSLTLREALSDAGEVAALDRCPDSSGDLQSLASYWYRSQLARRFHNESVAQVQQVRARLVVRALHLAGHAPLPQSVDLDDAWPKNLRSPDGASTV